MRLCECGCGEQIVSSRAATRFLVGHNGRDRRPAWERVLSRCVRDGACLVWQGVPAPHGYGGIHVRGKRVPVHRIAYEHFVGPIPPGLVLDHVKAKGCRFRTCCEPSHLEAVRQRENVARAIGNPVAENMVKTHCKHGHALTPDNMYHTVTKAGSIRRQCKTCVRLHTRKRTERGYFKGREQIRTYRRRSQHKGEDAA